MPIEPPDLGIPIAFLHDALASLQEKARVYPANTLIAGALADTQAAIKKCEQAATSKLAR
jgi:uncharacterized protein YqgV (UPF0045/DUF77 family)